MTAASEAGHHERIAIGIAVVGQHTMRGVCTRGPADTTCRGGKIIGSMRGFVGLDNLLDGTHIGQKRVTSTILMKFLIDQRIAGGDGASN